MIKSILNQLIKRTSYSLLSRNINNYSTINIKTTSIMTDYKGSKLELECINTIRAVSADMVQSANSGHPGAPMGCAPMAYLLWSEIMNFSATSPKWINRDRFVLSNGHACALQYVMLHLTGYADSKISDLKQFRQLGSTTPGHPECFVTAGT
jgi:transketolase